MWFHPCPFINNPVQAKSVHVAQYRAESYTAVGGYELVFPQSVSSTLTTSPYWIASINL